MLRSILFQNHPVYELCDGASVVQVAPQFGARLLNWKIDGQQVIYWPEEADWSHLAKVRGGDPILFPFLGRHMVNGEVGWWLDATGKKRALPMHGFARDSAFTVIPEDVQDTLRMRLVATPLTLEYYPFDFVFDVVYRLTGHSLEVRLEVQNAGADPMPYYMGHHFYFPVPHRSRAEWNVTVPSKQLGRQQPDGSIVTRPARAATNPASDDSLSDQFQIGLTTPEVSLLNSKTGQGVVIQLDAGGQVPWYCVTTWRQDAESDFYCVEPWTGLPNAIHHGQGLRYLAPGGKESAVCIVKAKR